MCHFGAAIELRLFLRLTKRAKKDTMSEEEMCGL